MPHTPGPWKRLDADDKMKEAWVAPDHDEGMDDARANYKLARAAPDLLAALGAMRHAAMGQQVDGDGDPEIGECLLCGNICDGGDDGMLDHSKGCAMLTARAAIAKARGA